MGHEWISIIVSGVLVLFQLGITVTLSKRRSEEDRIKRDIGKLYTRTEDNGKDIAVMEERVKNIQKICDQKHNHQ